MIYIANLFPYSITFKIDRKKGYNTLFSLFISIIVIAMQAYLAYYFSSDMRQRKNPQLNYKETAFKETYQLTMGDLLKSYDLKLKIYSLNYDPKKKYWDRLQKMNITELMKNNSLNVQDLLEFKIVVSDLKQSEENDDAIYLKSKVVTYEFQPIFNTPIPYRNEYAGKKDYIYTNITFNNNTKFNVNFTNNYYEGLNLTNSNSTIYKNVNWSNITFPVMKDTNIKVIMRNKLESKYQLRFQYLNKIIRYHDISINVDDEEIFEKFTEKYERLDNAFATKSKNYIRSIKYEFYDIKDDIGLIFNSFRYELAPIKLESALIEKTYEDQQDFDLLWMNFAKTKKHYDRNYKKLQNVAAEIGGIFSFLMLSGTIITSLVNSVSFNTFMINRLYLNKNWDSKQNRIIEVSKMQSKFNEMQNLIKMNKIKNMGNNKEDDDEDEDEIKKEDFVKGNFYLDRSLEKKKTMKKVNPNDIVITEKEKILEMKVLENYIRKETKSKNKEEEKEKIYNIDKSMTIKNINNLLNKEHEYENLNRKFLDDFKKNKLNFGFIKYIRSFIPCFGYTRLKEKRNYYEKAQLRIEQVFDTIFYYEFIEEFEKLKDIILNRNQIIASSFIKRRRVNDYFFNDDHDKDILRSLEYFNDPKNNSLIDHKIREHLNDTFCDLVYERK